MDRQLDQRVRERASDCCEYCRLPQRVHPRRFPIDHIIARQHGGADTESNLALSCLSCNLHKGPNLTGIDPLRNEITRLFNPRIDVWEQHFFWDGMMIRGLTAIGRTTVAVLKMNDAKQAAIRQRIW